MRKTELLIGAAALVIASVSVTLYLVNYTHQTKRTENAGVGIETPQQVISPKDLLAPARPGATGFGGDPETSASTSNGENAQLGDGSAPSASGEASGSDASSPDASVHAPASARKITYPTWRTSDAHVEEARAVTEAAGYIAPVWSPVGLDIAFTREARNAVFICGALPGGTARALINDAGSGEDFTWNRDGMSLRVKAADGQYDQVLITGERYPGGSAPERTFARDEKIYFLRTLRLGESKEVQISGPEDRFSSPKLSPDETRVVYRGAETGIYIAATDGSGSISIGPGSNPAWLPDSSGIVYDQQVSDGRSIVDADLWLATADGSIRTNLTNTPGIVELYPAIAPDGERITFSAGGSLYVGKLLRPKSTP